MNVMFDTHAAVVDLQIVGFTEDEAEAIVTVLKNAQAELATKRDLADLKKDLIIWLGTMIVFSFAAFTGLVLVLIK